MKIHYQTESIGNAIPVAATIGSFDGVHRGHAEILRKTQEAARQIGGQSLIISFNPHPRKIVNPDYRLQMLTTPQEQAALFSGFGIDNLLYLPFTQEVAAMSYSDFLTALTQSIQLNTLVMGYNNNFGSHREGNREKIATSGLFAKVNLVEVGALYYNGEAISSSRIRKTIEAGDISNANNMLGYAYPVEIVSREHCDTGQTRCSLTDNDKVVPPEGYYIASINQEEKQIFIKGKNIYLPEMTNIHQTFKINIISKNQY
ncbi:MAG: FAD synthetase family protein [Bacteroidales bacterium]|nr:FAD synthetase family protein [Bacteroidales bacterium]